MFPLFHMAIPLILCELLKKRFSLNRISLIIGSMLPDLIDKPLLILEIGSGRSFSHTLLFTFICFLIVFLASKENKPISFCLLLGLITHLLLDLPTVPLFYPFVLYDYDQLEQPVKVWFEVLFTNPLVYFTEIIGAIIFVFILVTNKLYSFQLMLNYLKTTPVYQ